MRLVPWRGRPATLLLRIGDGTIAAELVRRRRVLWSGTARYDTPNDVAEAIAHLVAEGSLPVRPCRLVVALGAPLVQVRRLRDLPPVRSGALRALVGHQAGRFFRRNGKPLVTDAAWERRGRWWGRTPAAERVVRAAAVEESWVEAIAAGARAAGLVLERIHPHVDPLGGGTGGPLLDLRSTAERERQHSLERLTVRRLAVAAAVLWLIASAVVVARVERERRRVDRALAALQDPLHAIVGARRQLGEVVRMIETVEAAEQRRADAITVAARIIQALPDSAYLTSIAVDSSGAGSLTGAAKHAVQVVAALERAGVGRRPALAGPAVREVAAGREWERFTVRFGAPPGQAGGRGVTPLAFNDTRGSERGRRAGSNPAATDRLATGDAR